MTHLDRVKKDLFEILEKAPWEAYAVRQAIKQGKIDGTRYGGECCCIKGIIANNSGLGATDDFVTAYGITLDGYGYSPVENYVRDIYPGMNPGNNEKCRQLLTWLDEFIAQEEAKKAAAVTASVQAGLEEVLAAAGLPAAEEAVSELVQV